MTRRAVVYARVAQADSGCLFQLEACRAYAKKHGYTVVGEFVDNGVSGNLPMGDRLQGQALLDALERREAQAVIVTTAGWLSRDFAHWQALVQQWQVAGIELHCVRGT